MLKIVKKSPNIHLLLLFTIVLLGGIYGINWSNKLAVCSPFFIFSLITTLVMAKVFDTKTAWITTLVCLIVSFLLQWTAMKWVHVFSFMGIFCAVYVCLSLFYRLHFVSLPTRIFMSLLCAILVDAAIMLPWEIYTLPISKFWPVFFRSLVYKASYASLAALSCWVFSLFKNKMQLTASYQPKKV
jgi:hypothetical protein